MLKKLVKKLREKVRKRIKKETKRKTKYAKEEYPNRFLKFYHLNKKRLSKERCSLYQQEKKAGVCTRCKRKAIKGIVFCKYHQEKQKEYNQKARLK